MKSRTHLQKQTQTENAMAKFYSSTFGAISGKHGSAVAVTRRDGISYIRMHVIPHNPRTDKQQAHRSKIGLVSKSLAPFNPIFKHTMGVTNGISIARSHAFKHAIVDEYPDFAIDYEKLMFSFGSLESVHNSSISFLDRVVSINWDFKKMYNCHANDSLSLVVYNKDANQALHIEDIALRKEKQAKIDIHESWGDSELYFWAYVRNGDKISDSVFVGKVYGVDIQEVDDENESVFSISTLDTNDINREDSQIDTPSYCVNSAHEWAEQSVCPPDYYSNNDDDCSENVESKTYNYLKAPRHHASTISIYKNSIRELYSQVLLNLQYCKLTFSPLKL